MQHHSSIRGRVLIVVAMATLGGALTHVIGQQEPPRGAGNSPGPRQDDPEALHKRVSGKVERIKEGVKKWAESGRDPSAILKTMAEKVGPLLDAGKPLEAEAELDRVLKAPGPGAGCQSGAGETTGAILREVSSGQAADDARQPGTSAHLPFGGFSGRADPVQVERGPEARAGMGEERRGCREAPSLDAQVLPAWRSERLRRGARRRSMRSSPCSGRGYLRWPMRPWKCIARSGRLSSRTPGDSISPASRITSAGRSSNPSGERRTGARTARTRSPSGRRDVKFVPFLWIQSLPRWVKDDSRTVYTSNVATGRETGALSIFAPETHEAYDRFFGQAKRELGDLADILRIGSPYDFGEMCYPAAAASAHFPMKNLEPGFWVNEAPARAHFKAAMEKKYGTVGRLNAAWGTSFAIVRSDRLPQGYPESPLLAGLHPLVSGRLHGDDGEDRGDRAETFPRDSDQYQSRHAL